MVTDISFKKSTISYTYSKYMHQIYDSQYTYTQHNFRQDRHDHRTQERCCHIQVEKEGSMQRDGQRKDYMHERVHSGYQPPVDLKNQSHKEKSAGAQMLVLLYNTSPLGQRKRKCLLLPVQVECDNASDEKKQYYSNS